MKKLLFSLVFFASLVLINTNDLKATHIAGGDIVYEYIGDSTGIPHEYCVYLTLYRLEEGAAGLGPTQTVGIESSCFPSTSITVNRFYLSNDSLAPDGGVYIDDADACIDRTDPGFTPAVITMHRYKLCNVVLPGTCADFTFSWTSCCRNGNITNLVNPGSQSFCLQATLNNTQGPNTSPDFQNPAAKFFCANQPFTWSQGATEPDMDSLRYTLAEPWGQCNTPLAFNPPWSYQYPMTTASGSFNLNASSGVMVFTPTGAEVDVIKIVVEEWRWDPDPTVMDWYRVGTSIRELQIPVLTSCNPIATSGVSISQGYTAGGVTSKRKQFNMDSLAGAFGVKQIVGSSQGGPNVTVDIIGYDCYDTLINVKVDGDLKCSTIDTDGSDFRLIAPDGTTIPVVGIDLNCQTTLLTSDFNLILHKPLDQNGDYLLQVRYGNDSTTIENECGFGVKNFFSMLIRVENCPDLEYGLENVTVVADSTIQLDWYIIDSTYNPKLFNNWRIWRARGENQFYPVASIEDHTVRSYVDTAVGPYEVDKDMYRYGVQLIQNSNYYREWTNHIHSILLSDTLNSDSTGFDLYWTPYNGWPSPTYEVFLARYDSVIANIAWENFDGPDSNFLETEYLYPDPVLESDLGTYLIKVEATDEFNTSNPYYSESNWIVFDLIEDPENPPPGEKLYIPNVFTPNGDGVNATFAINPGSKYGGRDDEIHVAVYNRWGKQVHEYIKPSGVSYDGREDGWTGVDMSTGNMVADGVYYYVIRLTDNEDNTMEEFKGHITIIGGTN